MLKKGFTTGTCAQAAAKAACIMLINRRMLNEIGVKTPGGKKLNLRLIGQKIRKNSAQCAVIKDSGDEPDVTNGARIYAKVKFSSVKGISIKGGKGVGKITKPGLSLKVGEWAINPVPRRMILEELSPFLLKDKGFEVSISVPEGKELAKQTYNPKLGIMGGISIIGTTGIVEPKSVDAYKASLALELDVLKAAGIDKVFLVLGYVSERFCKEKLKVQDSAMIKIGDHIGFMLENSLKKKLRGVVLVGHLGKLIKVTNGQFNTHFSFGDKRLESLAHYAESCGGDTHTIHRILSQKTAEAAIGILRDAGLSQVFARIAKDVVKNCRELVSNGLEVNCILLSLTGEVLARTG